MQQLGYYTDEVVVPIQTPTMHLVLTTKLLTLNTADLQEALAAELAANPALEMAEERRCPQCGCLLTRLPCPNCQNDVSDTMIYEVQRYPVRTYGDTKDDDEDWRPQNAEPVTLAEYVWGQLAPALTRKEQEIGRYLVDRLDEHGLLPEHPAEIATYLDRPLDEVQRVLRKLQQTEPVGVGAADPQECLRIQLEHLAALGQSHPTALALVTGGWSALTRWDFAGAADAAGCTVDEAHQALAFIQEHLYPRPADLHWSGPRNPERPPERLREPDIVIRKPDNSKRLIVELYAPSPSWLRVNPTFRRLAQEARAQTNGGSPPEWTVLADQASLFIKSLAQRNQTMRLVINHLVQVQRAFILRGDRYLKPMTRAALAAEVGVHESTISRAVSRKNVALPSGRVVPLAIFFDRALATRDRIREIIENENAGRPLSDGKIAVLLLEQGVSVARRTVAKYRTALGILPAHMRHKHMPAA
jgi:RNA polymerase sigma-54 factor